ncbi:MAG TPA: PadR family transcriptional regulator [Steroidobacteraceae bacterium]|jgi:DNA-binding PadR family transcriptional regulator|nr:PadR family transcriptional regulator [Steroidobacteraceae bacterium]
MHRHFGRHGHGPFQGYRRFFGGGCQELDPSLHAGGHHHRGGFGRFGFMGEMFMGPESFRGRKMGSVDLRLVLLTLLAERPSHGYELIKALEDRSGGFYSPSPGMVYPALTWLEEVGYASVTAEGAKKLYAITDSGRAYLVQHQDAADSILSQLAQIARKLGRIREAFAGFEDEEHGGTASEVGLARRELKQALRAARDASPQEQTRIAQILKDAAAKIRAQD